MDKLLIATHEGKFPLGENTINCAVLEDSSRIITQSAIFKAFGRTKRGRGKSENRVPNMPAFIDAYNIQPFVNERLMSVLKPIEYIDLNKKQNIGYDARILPRLCKAYLDAKNAGVLKAQQIPIVIASEILLVGLSEVGIIGIVDEASGYQYDREHFELQKILSAYISEEILKWQLTFTDDFYKEIFRLWNIPYISQYIKRKPPFIGSLTTKYIYDELPNGVVAKIKDKTPKTKGGNYKYRWHQSLTPEVGKEHLKKQIIEVTTLMSISKSKEEFQKLFQHKYGKAIQLEMEFAQDLDEVKPSSFNKSLKQALDYNPNKDKK